MRANALHAVPPRPFVKIAKGKMCVQHRHIDNLERWAELELHMPENELTVKAAMTFALIEGDALDQETLLDAFAATVGKRNTAKTPLRVTIGDAEFGDTFSVYECVMVDDA